MIERESYKVTSEIKIHTKPLHTVRFDRTGIFKKETPSYYIFDTFRVRKANVVCITKVL